MLSQILQKNGRWGIYLYWEMPQREMPQRSFFWRIWDNIFSFEIYWPLVMAVLSPMSFLNIKSPPQLLNHHIIRHQKICLHKLSIIGAVNLSEVAIICLLLFHNMRSKGCLSLFHHSIDIRTDINLSILCRKNIFCWNFSTKPSFFYMKWTN